MPTVILLESKEAADAMTDSVFDKLAEAIQKAVADILVLKEHQVGVGEMPFRRTRGCGNLLALCLASASKERLEKIDALKESITTAILSLSEDQECAAFFRVVGSAESWPIMPPGSWGEFMVS